jgi:carboxymethylenebutenolidase
MFRPSNAQTILKVSDGSDVEIYTSKPGEGSKWPAVMILHQVFGLVSQIKRVADRFAEQGYFAVAPNLYTPEGSLMNEEIIQKVTEPYYALKRQKINGPDQERALFDSFSETEKKVARILFLERELYDQRMCTHVLSCANFLAKSPEVISPDIAIVGFCMGGSVAFQASTKFGFNSTIVFYGENPQPLENVSYIAGDVLAIYGGEDTRINRNVPSLVEQMFRHKKNFQMRIYKGATHAFFNEDGPTYHKPSAEDAWALSLGFLNKRLKE